MLRDGPAMVAIPGPSIVPERVMRAMNRSMPDIYGDELVELAYATVARLPALARTTGHAFVSIGNGHAGWEMAISNTLSRGDKVLVLESGRFATAWGERSRVMGIEPEVLPCSEHEAVDPALVAERLSRDTDHEFKAILVVQTDTASSVRNDIPAIREAISSVGHPALFMVDCIASLGCERYEMDKWGVDVTVGAAQKGLMVPPGLAFVWANERAVAAYATADLRTGYMDWGPRLKPEVMYEMFSGTPPVQHLYGLSEALDMIDEVGLEAVWERHIVLATAVRAAVAAWSAPDGISFNIHDPGSRSHAVTTVLTGEIDADELRRRTDRNAGLVLGLGIGSFGGRAFRIGHMGHLNPPAILGTLGTVEAGLRSWDAPMGASGVAAAAASIATKLAE